MHQTYRRLIALTLCAGLITTAFSTQSEELWQVSYADTTVSSDDQAQIDEIFSPLSQVNGLAPTPDAEREYVVEIWEPETIRLGQSADDVGEYKGLEVVTYEGSDVVTLTVVPISLSINLSSEGGVADAIRALA